MLTTRKTLVYTRRYILNDNTKIYETYKICNNIKLSELKYLRDFREYNDCFK